MLQDTLTMAATLPGIDRFLCYVEEGDAVEYFREVAPDCRLLPQEGDDLGERMAGAFRRVFELGYARAVIIGTDIPHLPARFVSESLERLDGGADAVFVPCEDGGYCLLALRRVYRELFEGIVWSTDEVLATSLTRAQGAGIAVELLPRWHDLDTADDLRRPELLEETNGAVLTRAFIRGLRLPGGTGAGAD
jgi:hypothetical protein